MKRFVFLVVVALAVLVVCCFSFLSYLLYQSSEAEKTYHAELLSMDLVCGFVEHEDRWPRDWDELLDVNPEGASGIWSWPEDVESVQRRVEIDFSYDITNLRNVTPDTFDGIEPKGSSFPHSDGWLNRLKREFDRIEIGSS